MVDGSFFFFFLRQVEEREDSEEDQRKHNGGLHDEAAPRQHKKPERTLRYKHAESLFASPQVS